jgi:hypothetical protein
MTTVAGRPVSDPGRPVSDPGRPVSDPGRPVSDPGRRDGGVVEVLGVRHHGPGSARAVLAELDRVQPDAVLVEGPADGDALLPWVVDEAMQPPVALLGYAVDDPGRAVFWPFASFSPEWQAICWAVRNGVTVRFCDLPSGAVLARRTQAGPDETAAVPEAEAGEPDATHRETGAGADGHAEDEANREGLCGVRLRTDPIAVLAAAAGHDDPERWWDDLVEHRSGGGVPFPALAEAMAAVREHADPQPEQEHLVEQRREAHMRQVIREVRRSGARHVVVVCGAWHAPALTSPLPPAAHDRAVLRGLPKVKSALTWVPWSHSRLAQSSGYGAGVDSPGWYHHLFTATDRPVTRWFTKVARELRREDLPVSSAHVIEAVRLAETLATLRDRPLPGLAEVTEATRAVLCEGDELALRLVSDRLVVGEALGGIPDGVPTVPLAADLNAQARRCRLRPDAAERALDLDLRNGTDLNRSRLLHRLLVLDVPWGSPRTGQVRSTGTFRETWTLRWTPELAVAVVEAALWGTTVEAAATARLVDRAGGDASLGQITAAVERGLLADLPQALPELLRLLDARAAGDLDVLHLMDALPALVRSLRYGDVRGTDTAALRGVADALTVRISAALPSAVTGLDDAASAELRRHLDGVHEALALRAELPGGADVRRRWLDLLAGIVARDDLPGLLAGRFTRLLLDASRVDAPAAAARLQRALSLGMPAPAKGAWVEGFLGGGGLLLAHDAALLGLLDAWVSTLSRQDFTDVLPLLRRTFGSFAVGERRLIGEQVRRAGVPPGAGPGGRAPAAARHDGWDVDEERARPALLAAARLLGAAG